MDEHTPYELAYKNGYAEGHEKGYKEGFLRGFDAGKQDAQKWIPVTERLPDEFAQYLCIVIRPIRGGGYVRETRVLWCDYDRSWNCDEVIVTHWMPLPSPPSTEVSE